MTNPPPFASAAEQEPASPASKAEQEPASPASKEARAGDGGPLRGLHIATLTHEGRFWDAFVELVDDPGRPEQQARLCFVPADGAGDETPARTAVIIIEPTVDEALAQARSLTQHQMSAMLRSAI